MQRSKFIVAVLAWIALSASLHAAAGADGITVSGAVDKPGVWTADRLKSELAADLAAISYTSRGHKHTANAVSLLSVLKAAGVQTQLKMDPKADPKIKNFELRLVVVVRGRDGYVAAFSLAELLADVGNRHVWLALDADGQALSPSEGPVRLMVPEDEKPARWIRGVQSIVVVNCAIPTTQPAN
jgi:Oxidoreductase molybdopterin binding domain